MRLWQSRAIVLAVFSIILAAFLNVPAKAGSVDLDRSARSALSEFFYKVHGGRELANRASGILVFPTVVKAGFGIGGEYGEGALLIRGQTAGYYNDVSGSFGFQLGAQARTVIIMFMTPEALDAFYRRDGWRVGVDGSVTVVTVGVGGAVDTNAVTSPVVGFILDQKGLMYNLTLEGSKISRIYR
jgi:lipid-binding SYLF domain-containing protein